ncbi:MAG: UDP-N-acetylglucosamine--N-acetylmuramyl-(pentapeptide) pyrophosphoryl-undecaprenol N-acetylglucosamine transferase [Chloroflexi bacterium]|nr:UDP-N-acetylglucosamine--N-acetylmuramyl-(pentapeptide) pyrophosphoryl-undecaprenol N-acetylglucosamine transferase [Chloroflexota bacterium]MQC28019.1 UDP-N-acetylglucosamine--N-acetylmuramyl-(pentapeptide) pyrophosphoryl-undecaprenol N-acetylglucosamine transferase [Chloroflexota bacterium]
MKFALAGGGTGGHAYPAIAVAERMRERLDTELVYYGTEHGAERTVAVDARIPYRVIPAAQMRGRSPFRIARGAIGLLRGTRATARWFAVDQPEAVFATGGYAAAPVGRAAKRAGVPLVLFLPDVRPGWAVRYMQRSAATVACAVDRSLDYVPRRKSVVTGYPVRRQFDEATREEGIRRFGLDPSLRTLLITGGSQGAHQINLVINGALRRLLDRVQIIHICGANEEQWLTRERERLPDWQRERYHLHAYTEEMAWAMAAADLAITRGGASIFGELPATGLPAIVIPLAAADQHLNAAYLAELGAAIALDAGEIGRLESLILELLDDDLRLEVMATVMRGLARPNAASKIAALVREVAER